MTGAERENTLPVLLTVTWSGDLEHFAMLRSSLSRSALADCEHIVIVQSEDLPLFQRFEAPGLTLRSSEEVLPREVEEQRRHARGQQARWGRRGTILAGSLSRHSGWPQWPRYTGWHTQQLSKFAAAAACSAHTVVVMDSDLIVTPHARISDFLPPQAATVCCFEHWQGAGELSRKVRHWQQSADSLLQLPKQNSTRFDVYYDTPFIFDKSALQALLDWLEARYQQPWWECLVNCPPRRWSEFGLYRAWLRHCYPRNVVWRGTDFIGYLHDASDPQRLAAEFKKLLHDRRCHYVTIHSQSSGRENWGPKDYADSVLDLLCEPDA